MTRLITLAAGFFLLFNSCTNPPDQPWLPSDYTFPSDSAYSIMTWNLENFVDGYDNPYIRSGRENRAEVDTQKIILFATVLRMVQPDVLVLQEVENDMLIKNIAGTYFPELEYRFFVADESPDWHQNVMIFSRYPLGAMQSYASLYTPIEGETDSLGLTPTQAMVNTRIIQSRLWVDERESLELFALHLKAGRGQRNEGWRMGQMRMLHQQMLAAGFHSKPIVLAGDFNTIPGADDLEFLLKGNPDLKFSNDLHDAGENAFTHPSDSLYRQLDYVVFNEPASHRYIKGSTKVVRALPLKEMSKISDHLPVIARFRRK